MKTDTLATNNLWPALKLTSLFSLFCLFQAGARADLRSSLAERSDRAASIIEKLTQIDDHAIPVSLLSKAQCIATVPEVVRVGVVFGARFGHGMVSCRVPGGWGAPVYLGLVGGSWGLQFGFEKIDLVLVFLNHEAMSKFTRGNFTLGADATIAAGPMGRTAEAGTDYQLTSEIYSYSRAKGLFAGLAIQGTSIHPDREENESIYGHGAKLEQVLTTPSVDTSYVQALIRYAL